MHKTGLVSHVAIISSVCFFFVDSLWPQYFSANHFPIEKIGAHSMIHTHTTCFLFNAFVLWLLRKLPQVLIWFWLHLRHWLLTTHNIYDLIIIIMRTIARQAFAFPTISTIHNSTNHRFKLAFWIEYCIECSSTSQTFYSFPKKKKRFFEIRYRRAF